MTGDRSGGWLVALAFAAVGCTGCSSAADGSPAQHDSAAEKPDAASLDEPQTRPRADGGAAGGVRAPRNVGRQTPRNVAEDGGVAEPEPPPDPPDLDPQSGLRIRLPGGMMYGFQVADVRAFLGIRFGAVPQRFMPAEPAAPWSGVFDATRYGPSCPQAANGLASSIAADEDCLTLDVYTPARVDTKLPVMVFIHGGAFVAGATNQYDASQLAARSMVVVAINYRLGPLGFFSHPALDEARPDAPSGSDGIRDQQLALRWVRANIGAFNGDRNRVTVFGESAGAISACIHWVSPSSRGLAQRYILQSGTCTYDGPGVQPKAQANELGQQLADALCPGEADPLACLRAKPAAELAEWGGDSGLWGPLWEPVIEGPHGVLPESPERLASRAEALAPLIIGTNQNEWGFFQKVAGSKAPTSVVDLNATIENAFGEHASLVAAHYAATNDAEANDVWIRLITDMSFRCPSRTLARIADGRGATAYLYSFEQGLAFHAYELDYVFGTDWVNSAAGGPPPSAALTAAIQRYWTRFAATGDPNGDPDPIWPRFETARDPHLVLVDPPHGGTALASVACDFWRSYWRQGGRVTLD